MTELWIISTLLGFISIGLGIAVTNLYGRLQNQDAELGRLHEIYAKKEDVNRDFQYIRESLVRIEENLTKKIDK